MAKPKTDTPFFRPLGQLEKIQEGDFYLSRKNRFAGWVSPKWFGKKFGYVPNRSAIGRPDPAPTPGLMKKTFASAKAAEEARAIARGPVGNAEVQTELQKEARQRDELASSLKTDAFHQGRVADCQGRVAAKQELHVGPLGGEVPAAGPRKISPENSGYTETVHGPSDPIQYVQLNSGGSPLRVISSGDTYTRVGWIGVDGRPEETTFPNSCVKPCGPPDPPSEFHYTRCRACLGAGEGNGCKCPVCNGTGRERATWEWCNLSGQGVPAPDAPHDRSTRMSMGDAEAYRRGYEDGQKGERFHLGADILLGMKAQTDMTGVKAVDLLAEPKISAVNIAVPSIHKEKMIAVSALCQAVRALSHVLDSAAFHATISHNTIVGGGINIQPDVSDSAAT